MRIGRIINEDQWQEGVEKTQLCAEVIVVLEEDTRTDAISVGVLTPLCLNVMYYTT